ncbi:hypothetical protein H8D36_00275 [archaeon]|nr:hypothetical protein [archaeon]MBL7057429.1 hypothetical protein [Candidatus Woesearchaeota archaeon]
MARDIGHDKCDIIAMVNSVEILPITNSPELPPEIIAAAKQVNEDNQGSNPNYFDGHKVGAESIIIEGQKARLLISPNRSYSQVCVSRDLDYNPKASPMAEMYDVMKTSDLIVLTKKKPMHVNPFSQGTFLLVNPDGNKTPVEDLPVVITIRGEGVDKGQGLRHHLAGYGDHAKGFQDFEFNHYDGIRSIGQELQEEGNILPKDLVGAPKPFALVQDPFELLLNYLAITRLTIAEVTERMKAAKDWREHENFEFIPLKELQAYAAENSFYSHSRPIVTHQVEAMMERFDRMRGK